MTTLVQSIGRRSGAVWSRTAVAVLAAVGGSLLIAALAQVSIRLPFTPVPITGQTFAVLLVGASYGPWLGAATVLLYLVEGALGLPFYAEGRSGVEILGLASATGGYLWGFVVGAWLVGRLSARGWDRSVRSSIGAMLIGTVVIYGTGVPWLSAALDVPFESALELGLYPFVIGDVLKVFVAAGLLPAAWRLLRMLRGRETPLPQR